jgi:formamidopyrimidine-DNA glycosylase
MLTGRFQYVQPSARKFAKTCMALTLEDGWQLRYSDQRLMGKIYVVPADDVMTVPMFADMGPDALDVSEEEFRARIRKHTGAVKNILTNHKFIAGVGNAYSDEILFEARIAPFRKRTELSDDESRVVSRMERDRSRCRSCAALRDARLPEWPEHGAPQGAGQGQGRGHALAAAPVDEIAPNQRDDLLPTCAVTRAQS